MVRISTSGTNPDGGGAVPPGRYHALVETAVLEANGAKLKVEFVFLAGTNGEGINKKFTDWFHFTPKAMSRALQFGVALGYLTKEQWKQASEQEIEIDLPLEQCAGRQLCMEIALVPYSGDKEEHKGKSFANVAGKGFALWHVLDEKCNDIPKDPTYHNLALQMAQRPAAPPVASDGGWGNV